MNQVDEWQVPIVNCCGVKAEGQNMYIANHAYSVVDMPLDQGQREIQELLDHASQEKYVCAVEWNDPGDLGTRPALYVKIR